MNENEKDFGSILAGMLLDTGVNLQSKLINLINDYKQKELDSIPVKEIEKCLETSFKAALGKDSLVNRMLKD